VFGAACGTGSPATETWTGQLTGTAVGAFVCISGTDASYSESAAVAIEVPGPGLVALLASQDTARFSGTFSNAETAHEASGSGCAPRPSVANTTTPETAVAIKKVQDQLQLSAATVLIPAHFRYSVDRSDGLDATQLFLTAGSTSADQVTGSWFAKGNLNTAVDLAGTFRLTRGGVVNHPDGGTTADGGTTGSDAGTSCLPLGSPCPNRKSSECCDDAHAACIGGLCKRCLDINATCSASDIAPCCSGAGYTCDRATLKCCPNAQCVP
jgi:hypothetical protein